MGFEDLREGQSQAIQSLLKGRDTLVIQPTGSGKSAIYQIAGLMIPGLTLVISPLIALQKDQLESIRERKLALAAVVNSVQTSQDAQKTFQQLEDDELEYLFLAPEQLKKEEIIEKLKGAKVSLFVIDEAHCISEWGHDFRPDYLNLGSVIEELGHPVVLAMTATASSEVREEIIHRLNLRDCFVVARDLDRPNISLRVEHFEKERDKEEDLVHKVRWADKPGIVYTATRKKAEELMSALAEEDVATVFYHAGLPAKDRDRVQQDFMEGNVKVLVATNAFGMGIDKRNIRFVYHFDISDSLDSYYQEVGRAGRDGEPAEAILFYRHQNLGIRKFQSGTGKLNQEQIEQVAAVVEEEDRPISRDEIVEKTQLSQVKVANSLRRLEDVGALKSLPTGEVELSGELNERELAEAAQEEGKRQERKKVRLAQMQEYAEIATCRRQYLLRYFGEELEAPCENCDNCAQTASTSEGTRREV